MSIASHIFTSIQTRLIIPCQQKHFLQTKWGKALVSYHNSYTGKRCFLIGNGPSLDADDLTKLYKAREVTFAFNRIYNIFDQTNWRPTFYISQDERMLTGCADIVSDLKAQAKFIPIQLKWWNGIDIDDATYFNIVNQRTEDPQQFCFSDDIAQCIYNSNTGMYTAAQIAAYMGFSEIYMIGVDHHFRVSQNNQGEIIVDNTAKDYFSDKYNADKDKLYIPNMDLSTIAYVAMKKHCDERGIKVFNATRGGKLEVFERVDFDTLF